MGESQVERWERPGSVLDRFFGWEPRTAFRRLLEESDFRVEEFTDGDQAVVRAELPGIDPDKDVEVRVRDHTLEIHAERRETKQTENKEWVHSEFNYGSFSRMIPLPRAAKASDVKASYRDGILEVRLPIDADKAESMTIPVERD
jgi:HSP20 family protein